MPLVGPLTAVTVQRVAVDVGVVAHHVAVAVTVAVSFGGGDGVVDGDRGDR